MAAEAHLRIVGNPADGPVAGQKETLDWFLESSGRRSAVPIHSSFVQLSRGAERTGGPLAAFVASRRALALDLYLLCLLAATAEPYNVARPAASWARAAGIGSGRSASTMISKQWRWLEAQRLVVRSGYRKGVRDITLLAEDGSGAPYKPTVLGGRYFRLPFDYWTDNWFGRLDLAEKSVLLIALTLGDGFYLPQARASTWYGVSSDTIGRGLRGLKNHRLLFEQVLQKPAPQVAAGFTRQHHYTLMPPFGPKGVRAAAADGVEIATEGARPPTPLKRKKRR